ncbi:cobyric acid synthase [Robertmurraya yapensis]|uniref:Cobyric acid synthase n=2 Tax=Bacillaceae TaxID=186817 RepID=A0A431W049_9BACI|nr:cobyric acid synthase [Bacillus yapensis]RTR28469.1 cobyric acid synthase [Bacillus yapensis]TKS94530.1 cobyric acid synthase [Bacillus yapensis]
MKGVMIQGTASDVGKSLIVTALCRLFALEGKKVTPFKSQNMSNNSYVTMDGKEIGRAQGIQAEAAKTEATVWMNPILLKPRSDMQSEVVLFGKAVETLSGRGYREHFYEKGLKVIEESLQHLQESYDVVVIEGAGSPVEINLTDRELVNMKVAELADVPVILVADIDRGGVFASIVGTLELLDPDERERVKGILINKFRGDVTLFEDGIKWLEEKTGVPVLGVLPYIENHMIDGEDSLSIQSTRGGNGEIDIAVIHLPFISNYSDIEPFYDEDDVSVRFIKTPTQFGRPDAVIIPGTKSTISDLKSLMETGLADTLIDYVKKGGYIVGLCGGYQMLGQEIIDAAGTDTGLVGHRLKGLTIIPGITIFTAEKKTVRFKGHYSPATGLIGKRSIEGYEIHLGVTELLEKENSFLTLEDGSSEGYYGLDGKIIGTYVHHLFHNDEWRNHWLNQIRQNKHLPRRDVVYRQDLKEAKFDELSLKLKKHLDWDGIKEIMAGWEKER